VRGSLAAAVPVWPGTVLARSLFVESSRVDFVEWSVCMAECRGSVYNIPPTSAVARYVCPVAQCGLHISSVKYSLLSARHGCGSPARGLHRTCIGRWGAGEGRRTAVRVGGDGRGVWCWG